MVSHSQFSQFVCPELVWRVFRAEANDGETQIPRDIVGGHDVNVR